MLSPNVLPNASHPGYMSGAACLELPKGNDMVLNRAFLVAYLPMGDIEQAERAALSGIESWNPDTESDELLFYQIVMAAASVSFEQTASLAPLPLPLELQNVVELDGPARSCFVLRVLAGVATEVCARWLDVSSHLVECYVCRALTCLGKVYPNE